MHGAYIYGVYVYLCSSGQPYVYSMYTVQVRFIASVGPPCIVTYSHTHLVSECT
jgi:hypothetical protein